MQTERHVNLFRNGVNQALQIPRGLELPDNKATIYKEGSRLIIEPIKRQSLMATLSKLQPL
jgi:antitoxin VapB